MEPIHFPWTNTSLSLNGISIDSAIFAWFTIVTNAVTCSQTCDICSSNSNLALQCRRMITGKSPAKPRVLIQYLTWEGRDAVISLCLLCDAQYKQHGNYVKCTDVISGSNLLMSTIHFWHIVLFVNILLFRLRDVSDRELSVRSNAGAARSCVDDQMRDWYNVRPANCDLVDPKRRRIFWSNTTASLKLQHKQHQ